MNASSSSQPALSERTPDRTTSSVSTDLLEVRHVTAYRYREPVEFGVHRGMFRPHDSHDLRLLGIEIAASPHATQRWLHDAFSNSITLFEFTEPAAELTVSCVFQIIRTTIHEPSFPIADHARTFPFDYASEHMPDLAPTMAPEYEDELDVKAWALAIAARCDGETWAILEQINSAIHREFRYARREEPGVQSPNETLQKRCGSCRDFAILMMEATRHLGFAARFVSGYLYDPLSDQDGQIRGAGSTHAWLQVFVPGAGWIEFDPTNGLIASGNLIRTAVARTPQQAAPLTGSFKGDSDAFLGMDVSVDVRALAPTVR
ncbi:MAG: transglutaminase family protein [Pseudomonadota bacterium]